MNIYFLRHGETNLNRTGKFQGAADKELNEYGKKQAELLGKRLQKYNIDVIYSSDAKRTVETSEIINEYVNKKIIYKEGLREISLGRWETLTVEERYKRDPEYAERWHKHLEDMPYPEGESGRDVKERAMKVLEEIQAGHHHNVAVVSSAGTIMILLSEFLGLEQYKRFAMKIGNCSISTVNYDPIKNAAAVMCINDTAHLEDL